MSICLTKFDDYVYNIAIKYVFRGNYEKKIKEI